MKEIRITMRCLAKKEHAKVIRVKARLGRLRALELADLLDGSSLAYVHPPGPRSPIGRCCICQGEVECEVSTVVDGAEAPLNCDEAMEDLARGEGKEERKLMEQLARAI
jgi:hypothetical protein